MLCYCRGRELRILDLRRSADSEIVVDLSKLVRETLPDTLTGYEYKLTLLYYSHNIVSCFYSDQTGRTNFLLVFNSLDGQILTVLEVANISKRFVRNNDLFLYYGTTQPHRFIGYWEITGFDITTRTWLDGNFPSIIDVGSTVCFEILDGYFYRVSNTRSLEEVGWVSYYSCVRFPLAQDGFGTVEELEVRQRDNVAEGSVDDRWTFLHIFKDETTGQLKATECRKERSNGTARRTYYTTEISFDKPAGDGTGSDISATETRQGEVPRTWPREDPHMVHVCDDNLTLDITFTKCPVRSYYQACQTFIDLVDDSGPASI